MSGYPQRIKTPEQALASAELVCARMERTASDVRRSLMRWGITEWEAQQEIIEKLIAAGFVDHRRYAASFVREKFNLSHWGEQKIRAALRFKGIDLDLIEEAIEENIDKDQEKDQFESDMLRRKCAIENKSKSPYELRVKLFRWAASRGFSIDQINTVLDKITSDDYEK